MEKEIQIDDSFARQSFYFKLVVIEQLQHSRVQITQQDIPEHRLEMLLNIADLAVICGLFQRVFEIDFQTDVHPFTECHFVYVIR